MVDSAAGGVSQLPTLTTYHFYRKGLGNMGMEISKFGILLYGIGTLCIQLKVGLLLHTVCKYNLVSFYFDEI